MDGRPPHRKRVRTYHVPGHDKNIWSLAKVAEKAVYCLRNPEERKLVRSPEQGRWSSFRWLEWGRKEGEPVVVGDWVAA